MQNIPSARRIRKVRFSKMMWIIDGSAKKRTFSNRFEWENKKLYVRKKLKSGDVEWNLCNKINQWEDFEIFESWINSIILAYLLDIFLGIWNSFFTAFTFILTYLFIILLFVHLFENLIHKKIEVAIPKN